MAIPNLVALLLLSPVVFKLSRAYFAGERRAPPQESRA
jgi:AGCS family alanine or glycine:cation symporter